jgi:L-lactate dehydrogenase complex protein LldF
MKARSAGGAALPASVTLVDGPAGPGRLDGPDELVLVIVDNGRSDLLGWGYGEALACLHCGACLNVCPVYREIGGQAYGGSPAGPIGSLVLPLLPAPDPKTAAAGQRSARFARIKRPARQAVESPAAALASVLHDTAFADLPLATTLCGACAEVCPVGIDIPRLLIRLRGDLMQASRMARRDKLGRRLFAWSMKSPEHYGRLHRWLARGSRPLGKVRLRRLPPPAARTFRERWQAAQGDRR